MLNHEFILSLNQLGASGSELDILKRKQEVEDNIAQQKLDALVKEQAIARQLLDIDNARQKLTAQIAANEAELAFSKASGAQLSAVAALEEAQKSGDQTQIDQAAKILDIQTKILDITGKQNVTQDLTKVDARNKSATPTPATPTSTLTAAPADVVPNTSEPTNEDDLKKKKQPSLFDQAQAAYWNPVVKGKNTNVIDQSMSVGLDPRTSAENYFKRNLGLDTTKNVEQNLMLSRGLDPSESAEDYQKRMLGLPTKKTYTDLQTKPITPDLADQAVKTPMAVAGYTNFVNDLKEANKDLVGRLDKLIEVNSAAIASPRTLNVSSPQPVQDGAKIFAEISRQAVRDAGL